MSKKGITSQLYWLDNKFLFSLKTQFISSLHFISWILLNSTLLPLTFPLHLHRNNHHLPFQLLISPNPNLYHPLLLLFLLVRTPLFPDSHPFDNRSIFFSGSSFILAFHFLGYVYLCMWDFSVCVCKMDSRLVAFLWTSYMISIYYKVPFE